MSKWDIEKVLNVVKTEGIKALAIGGEIILSRTINNVPIDTGTLRRSGTVTIGGIPQLTEIYEQAKAGTVPKQDVLGTDLAVYISFNTPYARRQHEELHWTHPRGGKAKYLEDTFNASKKEVLKYIERTILKALEKEA